jgi:hypothetical protein
VQNACSHYACFQVSLLPNLSLRLQLHDILRCVLKRLIRRPVINRQRFLHLLRIESDRVHILIVILGDPPLQLRHLLQRLCNILELERMAHDEALVSSGLCRQGCNQ